MKSNDTWVVNGRIQRDPDEGGCEINKGTVNKPNHITSFTANICLCFFSLIETHNVTYFGLFYSNKKNLRRESLSVFSCLLALF